MTIDELFLLHLSGFLDEEPDLKAVEVLQRLARDYGNVQLAEEYYRIRDIQRGDRLGDPALTKLVYEIEDALEDDQRQSAEEQRQLSVSTVVAAEASLREEVRLFRSEVLDDEMVAPDAIEAWIDAQCDAEGTAKPWLAVPLPEEVGLERSKEGHVTVDKPVRIGKSVFSERACRLWYEKIHFYVRQRCSAVGWKVAARPISPGGRLDRLKTLAANISEGLRWRPAVAVSFILSGVVPEVPFIEAVLTEAVDFSVGARVMLDVSISATPAEVAEAYKEAREKSISGKAWTRKQSSKHLRLAEFCARTVLTNPAGFHDCGSIVACMTSSTWDWTKVLERWNAVSKEHAYAETELATFKRDCRNAVKRIPQPGTA